MSDEPYLILHKVRGQPAFDVAHPMQVGDEIWWIVTTSGHRAYPLEYKPLAQRWAYEPHRLAALPDHYRTASAPKTNLRELLAKIVRPVASNFKKRAI